MKPAAPVTRAFIGRPSLQKPLAPRRLHTLHDCRACVERLQIIVAEPLPSQQIVETPVLKHSSDGLNVAVLLALLSLLVAGLALLRTWT